MKKFSLAGGGYGRRNSNGSELNRLCFDAVLTASDMVWFAGQVVGVAIAFNHFFSENEIRDQSDLRIARFQGCLAHKTLERAKLASI